MICRHAFTIVAIRYGYADNTDCTFENANEKHALLDEEPIANPINQRLEKSTTFFMSL